MAILLVHIPPSLFSKIVLVDLIHDNLHHQKPLALPFPGPYRLYFVHAAVPGYQQQQQQPVTSMLCSRFWPSQDR